MTEIEFLTNPAEKISAGFKLIFKRQQKQDISCTRDYTLRFTSTTLFVQLQETELRRQNFGDSQRQEMGRVSQG